LFNLVNCYNYKQQEHLHRTINIWCSTDVFQKQIAHAVPWMCNIIALQLQECMLVQSCPFRLCSIEVWIAFVVQVTFSRNNNYAYILSHGPKKRWIIVSIILFKRVGCNPYLLRLISYVSVCSGGVMRLIVCLCLCLCFCFVDWAAIPFFCGYVA